MPAFFVEVLRKLSLCAAIAVLAVGVTHAQDAEQAAVPLGNAATSTTRANLNSIAGFQGLKSKFEQTVVILRRGDRRAVLTPCTTNGLMRTASGLHFAGRPCLTLQQRMCASPQ